ncbi:MAG: ubiquinone/menaquinone biosynthesis protein [Cyanobacteria bacterium RYN_339]|nr:ubiquinone/menaquinone biosynthesis protein [Cyanobacteria bacterium RYN_339]
MDESLMELPLLAYANARSLHFTSQYQLLMLLNLVHANGVKPDAPELFALARREKERLFERDVRNIVRGVYPVEVLAPENPVAHWWRFPAILADGLGMSIRRAQGQTEVFDEQAAGFKADVPFYYQRNFHFQTNGYLSETSAELYEHQVEMLFGGMADAMRRLVISPLKQAFAGSDGEGLVFLELGAGTGRSTRFVKLAFPKARVVALDLSAPYLQVARKRMSGFSRTDFLQGDGANLPFQDGLFDAVYSVFMFHEMPLPVRQAVMSESRRVIKPGGILAMVDSMQKGDRPDLDPLLANFSANYHEPFYQNYVRHPIPELMAGDGFDEPGSDFGGLSKVVWSRRQPQEASSN